MPPVAGRHRRVLRAGTASMPGRGVETPRAPGRGVSCMHTGWLARPPPRGALLNARGVEAGEREAGEAPRGAPPTRRCNGLLGTRGRFHSLGRRVSRLGRHPELHALWHRARGGGRRGLRSMGPRPARRGARARAARRRRPLRCWLGVGARRRTAAHVGGQNTGGSRGCPSARAAWGRSASGGTAMSTAARARRTLRRDGLGRGRELPLYAPCGMSGIMSVQCGG